MPKEEEFQEVQSTRKPLREKETNFGAKKNAETAKEEWSWRKPKSEIVIPRVAIAEEKPALFSEVTAAQATDKYVPPHQRNK